MNSATHAVVSLVVAGLALALTAPPVPAWAVVAVALVAGVGIDVDHFALAWYNTGRLDPVRRCLGDPRIVVLAQDEIFETGTVGAVNRLLSHAVIGGVAVPLAWLASPYLAGVTAASLYAHVLADLVGTARSTVVLDADDPRLD